MTAPSTAGLRTRTLIFAALVACAFLGILGRLTYLQIVKHDEYSRLAESQHAKTVPLRPQRGGGVEQIWDAHLAGAEGRALVERDALGRHVTGAPIVLKASVPGQGVALTIDATLQYMAEKEVEAAWRRTRSKAAMAVMMDPRTGEILALAIRPTYNPNKFATETDQQRPNRATTEPFTPGSP